MDITSSIDRILWPGRRDPVAGAAEQAACLWGSSPQHRLDL